MKEGICISFCLFVTPFLLLTSVCFYLLYVLDG